MTPEDKAKVLVQFLELRDKAINMVYYHGREHRRYTILHRRLTTQTLELLKEPVTSRTLDKKVRKR